MIENNIKSTKDPKVSVIIPIHNRELYVAESIESVLDQTYTDFEFLICDDCSTDNTWQVLEKSILDNGSSA